MELDFQSASTWLLGPEPLDAKHPGHLWPRWIFLRALGLIYFSAFYSLLFQIKGLIGPNGILPAADYLKAVAATLPAQKFWFAPTLFWFNAGDRALMAICWLGVIASILLVLNIWPRASLVICFICFLSFICSAQDFSSYQSDGMLLEAGFLALFFSPPGFLPGLGRANPPSRASLFLLQWEWFRIYFESGVAKIGSGDIAWRNFTAMDDYYQNGPLPTWIGWYVQQLPHWFHASTVFYTLATELVLVWMLFLPRRFRILCFCIVTPFEISIILTANYAFLNYLVLLLGFLLLDDRVIEWLIPRSIRDRIEALTSLKFRKAPAPIEAPENEIARVTWRERFTPLRRTIAAACLAFIFYCATAQLIWMLAPSAPLPQSPLRALEPFRIANRYGLFAVMTHGRYEIEFQGSQDGKIWTPYPFRYKPQDIHEAPGIYAPYQPRFEWNLWFASLGPWRESRFVVWTEERLIKNDEDVLELFAKNPFAGAPPRQVRSVIYQYWFTDLRTKRATGNWWRRELLGEYAPALARTSDGKIAFSDLPTAEPPEP
ncbi:MAG TPA: lipase maturation factor family protein [Candidatus Sulfotelmatobacter sp.]|nr:lipase maturation factor family protein [Candidatus Sulfotelmatobacter sp.]